MCQKSIENEVFSCLFFFLGDKNTQLSVDTSSMIATHSAYHISLMASNLFVYTLLLIPIPERQRCHRRRRRRRHENQLNNKSFSLVRDRITRRQQIKWQRYIYAITNDNAVSIYMGYAERVCHCARCQSI